MTKLNNEDYISDWAKRRLNFYDPEYNHIEEPKKEEKVAIENQWVKAAATKFGGTQKLARAVGRSPAYIYNVMKGFAPLSKDLEEIINEKLRKHS